MFWLFSSALRHVASVAAVVAVVVLTVIVVTVVVVVVVVVGVVVGVVDVVHRELASKELPGQVRGAHAVFTVRCSPRSRKRLRSAQVTL